MQPSLDFALSSNNVSENARNATIIGTMVILGRTAGDKTVKHSFKVADRNQPFRMIGDKLIVVIGAPLDYETTKSVTIVVELTSERSKTTSKSFMIVITSE